ncbi:hypothetical protein V2J09_013191 [Rumex salicifolius]
MALESDWTKHGGSSEHKAQVIISTTSLGAKSLNSNQTSVLSMISLQMPDNSVSEKKRLIEASTCLSISVKHDVPKNSKSPYCSASCVVVEPYTPILPGLSEDVAKLCLALVPRSNFSAMGAVSKRWRSFIKSKEFITVRKQAGMLEEWLYVLTTDKEGKQNHWEVLDCYGNQHQILPLMPGQPKASFSVVVLNGKLLVIAGFTVEEGSPSASADVYQYDSCLNCWDKLDNLNLARYDFACAEVYVVGGYGVDGESLSSAEVYDPDTDKWTLIESIRRPRWGCFAYGFESKLYVMGGRSSFTIGNSKSVDVYDPDNHTWSVIKNGCVMVTAHAGIGKKLYCMEWKNQRKLAIFNPEDSSWKTVPIPLTGSSSIGFRFGVVDGKLLLFSLKDDPSYRTLLYDPDAVPGKEWRTSHIKPSGLCMCSVTIKA